MLGSGADPLEMGDGMHALDVLAGVLAQRRFLALQIAEHLVRQHLVDRAHAVGTLGMTETGVVLGECGVGKKERGH
jgi:hypothetical protein